MIIQGIDHINKSMLFLMSEIMFEFLKLRLNEICVVNEHYDILNYDQFYEHTMFNAFEVYMGIMKNIMRFYNSPSEA